MSRNETNNVKPQTTISKNQINNNAQKFGKSRGWRVNLLSLEGIVTIVLCEANAGGT
jgi:uncharacterized membrane protein YcaP (DUF421 family)